MADGLTADREVNAARLVASADVEASGLARGRPTLAACAQ
jgi:hypothetical protein